MPRANARPFADSGGDGVVFDGPDSGFVAIDVSLVTSALSIGGGVALTGTITADTLTVAGTLALTGAADLITASATLESGALLAQGGGATLEVDGTLALAGDAAALDGGTISAQAVTLDGGTLDVDASSAIGIGGWANTGTIVVTTAGTLAGSGRLNAPFWDDGMVVAQGGALSVFGDIAGGGTLAIGDGGTLYVTGAIPGSLALQFIGENATLELFSLSQTINAPLSGFATSDALAFAASTIVSALWQQGTLTLTDSGGNTLALALAGGYDSAVFVPLPDADGGSAVALASASIAGLVGADATLGDGGDLVALQGTTSITTLTIDQQVALTGVASIGTLTLAGTLAVLPGASLAAGDIAGDGLLAVEGAGSVTVADATALAATLDLLGGAAAAFTALTLAGGALLVDAGSALTVGAIAGEAGTLAVAAGATLSGYGRLAAPSDIEGVAQAQGGALVVGAAVSGGGSLAIASGATLFAFAPITVPVAFAARATLALESGPFTGTLAGFAPTDALDVAGQTIDTVTWTAGTLTLLSAGATLDSIAIAGNYRGRIWQTLQDGGGGTLIELTRSATGSLDLTGSLTIATSLSVPSALIESGAVLTMAGGTLNAGSVAVQAGGSIGGAGLISGSLVDAGTLEASGGVLTVTGSLSGPGAVLIDGGAALAADAGIDAATSVSFTGESGTLDLFGSALATGATIAGLAASAGAPLGNVIDIEAAVVTAASYSDLGGGFGALALSGADGSLGTLMLSGIMDGASPLVQPDGNGGSLIQLVPCFAAGTRIATPAGAVAIERLAVGDLVLTPSGPRAVRWLGRRGCDSRAAAELRPVRVAAGALGGGVPARDLLLSPRHALLIGRVLVPAVALVNGRTVRREPAGAVIYHHLALDSHDTVLAEAAAAETYLPSGDQVMFDAESGQRPLPAAACAPRLESGADLAALRGHLFGPAPIARPAPPGALRGHIERIETEGGRTRLVGWALDADNPHQPVALLAMRDGIACGCAVANHWRADLDRAGLADGSCGFVLEVPAGRGRIGLRRPTDGAWLPAPAQAG